MMSPRDIQQKAERKYLDFLRMWLADTPFFPFEMPVGALPMKDFNALREGTLKLQEYEKTGYRIEYETIKTRMYNEQSLPKRIIIDDETTFLKFIKKQAEFQAFQRDVTLIRAKLPQLEQWLIQMPQHVITYHDDWEGLLAVCLYFLQNPRPACYIRELPIEIHTKFIEQHSGILRQLLDFLLPPTAISDEKEFEKRYGLRYEEPLIRLRFLDKQLQHTCNSPFSDISVTTSEMAANPIPCQTCLIVENKMTFLSLPPLPKTIAIWGAGFKVDGLRDILWLAEKSIYCWSDLDAQGFEILSRLRSIFPQTKSILMDDYTLQKFVMYCTSGTPSNQQLQHLTNAEEQVYQYLVSENQRLEQEHLSHSFVVSRLQAIIDDF